MVRSASSPSPSSSSSIAQCVPLLPASHVPLKYLQGFIVSSVAHIYLSSRFTFGQVCLSPSLTRINQLISCQTAPPGRCLPPSFRLLGPLPREIVFVNVPRVFPRRVWPSAAQCANERVYLDDAEPGYNGDRACFIWCVFSSCALSPPELDKVGWLHRNWRVDLPTHRYSVRTDGALVFSLPVSLECDNDHAFGYGHLLQGQGR